MNPALWAALGATGALLLVLVGVALAILLSGRRARAHERDALASAQADVEALRAQVEELSSALVASRGAADVVPPQVEYVITTAGEESPEPADLPEGTKPGKVHRRDQANAARAQELTAMGHRTRPELEST